MTTAIESGDPVTRAWLGAVRRNSPHVKEEFGEETWYADPKYWAGTFDALFMEMEDEDDAPEVVHHLTPEKLAKGLQLFAEKQATKFQTIFIDSEHDHDAGDADLVLQYALFGEEKYA